jgi:hypothetical protein
VNAPPALRSSPPRDNDTLVRRLVIRAVHDILWSRGDDSTGCSLDPNVDSGRATGPGAVGRPAGEDYRQAFNRCDRSGDTRIVNESATPSRGRGHRPDSQLHSRFEALYVGMAEPVERCDFCWHSQAVIIQATARADWPVAVSSNRGGPMASRECSAARLDCRPPG